jgi:3-oxoacyl-[acyl-carrier protein] reductase
MRLARDGAAVIVSDLAGPMEIEGKTHQKMDLLDNLVAEIKAEDGMAAVVRLDVSDQADVLRAVALTKSQFGEIDILVNNAGSLAGSDDFLNTTADQWQQSFQVNLLGPMMLSKAVIPDMQAKGGGVIINIGSTGSLGAEAGFGAYTTMKHGLVGLTKTIAAEFGVDGIRCNVVCPGYIKTDMHMAANERLAKENNISVPDMMDRRYANVALRNAGEARDVADAVAYLVGPQATYVTGVVLPVAGGVPCGI